jgi:hypothetical protein
MTAAMDPSVFLHAMAPYRFVIGLAFVDPLVIAIGLWMGWHADQAAKLLLAGLAAALAATLASFLVRFVGLSWFEGGFYFGGGHALARFVAGTLWAALGYGARRMIRPAPRPPTR